MFDIWKLGRAEEDIKEQFQALVDEHNQAHNPEGGRTGRPSAIALHRLLGFWINRKRPVRKSQRAPQRQRM